MAEADQSPELTERQYRFVSEYVADPNATQAYMRAFACKSYTTAKNEGCQLLTNPYIQAHIKDARENHARKCGVTFRRTLRKLGAIAFQDAADFYESDGENGGMPKPRKWDDIDPSARKNIAGIKFKRRKLRADCKSTTKVGDTKHEVTESYELEEMEYKTLDPMAALALLCKYLGITKGSLTADDLRAILFAQPVPGATPKVASDDPAAHAGSGTGSGAESDLHDEE